MSVKPPNPDTERLERLLKDGPPEPQTPALERFQIHGTGEVVGLYGVGRIQVELVPSPEGQWVPYESVASLLADRERLQTENNILVCDLDQQIAELKAEVERLTRENAELKTTNTRLNRRAQSAEAAADTQAEDWNKRAAGSKLRNHYYVRAIEAERRAEALKGYAQHKEGCGVFACAKCEIHFEPNAYHERQPKPCSCGLSALLTEPDPHV